MWVLPGAPLLCFTVWNEKPHKTPSPYNVTTDFGKIQVCSEWTEPVSQSLTQNFAPISALRDHIPWWQSPHVPLNPHFNLKMTIKRQTIIHPCMLYIFNMPFGIKANWYMTYTLFVDLCCECTVMMQSWLVHAAQSGLLHTKGVDFGFKLCWNVKNWVWLLIVRGYNTPDQQEYNRHSWADPQLCLMLNLVVNREI